jgi:hypothetical protein
MTDQKEADAAAAMSAAGRLLDQLDACSHPPERTDLLALASFFLRLSAAFLLEKDLPALPEGPGRLIARDQSRLAGRDLCRRLLGKQSSFLRRKPLQLPPEPRRPGRPLTDHDRRLGAEAARTLQDLQVIRADLLCEYLFLGSHLPPADELPEPTAGALTLLHK